MITIKLKHIAYIILICSGYWLISHLGLKKTPVRFQCLEKGVIGDKYGVPCFYIIAKYPNEVRTVELGTSNSASYIHYKVGSFYLEYSTSIIWKE